MTARASLALGALAALALVTAAPAQTPAPAQGRELQARKLTARITEPVDADFVFGKARIGVEVEAPPEMRDLRVEFNVGGKLVYIDREPPYELFFDFGSQPRSWVIEVAAIAPGGAEARHTIVTRKLNIDYHEEVDRVVITASVTDKDRKFVAGLTRDDFQLFEDDVRQQIVDFGEETRPITLAVLIDTSGSMREELSLTKDAAKRFIDTLRAEDRALIVDFDENVYLLHGLTSDHSLLHAAIDGTDAEGGTALYDAIYAAYRRLRGIEGRRAMALLSDGADTNSQFSYKKVLELTRTNDVTIYSIGLGATVLDVGIRGSLKQLADETGGRSYFPNTAGELNETYDEIAQDLRSQYFLTYAPSNSKSDGTWRQVRLETTAKNAKIKTRKGYYAVKK